MNCQWILPCIAKLLTFSAPINSTGISIDSIPSIEKLLPSIPGGQKFKNDSIKFTKNALRDVTPANRQAYDFIIVGAGSAGATIASRLTEINNAKVLLIEAGGNENLFMNIPLNAIITSVRDKSKHWNYATEASDKYCRGMENNRCKIPSGKVMGGSSSVGAMIATRGNKKNYDTWANLTGDNSWSWNGMLKYFKKMETYDVTLADINKEVHGYNGPVHITNAINQSELARAFVESGKEFGFPTNIDYNSGRQTGFAYLQTNQMNGERMSTNRAYLYPVKSRKNLFVSTKSRVNKVLINPKNKTAYGVEFTKNNKKIVVIARKEVIVCAGAIGSPKILMLSGIGPAKHLKSLKINVLKDAPVGENLMDHVSYGGLAFLTNETSSIVLRKILKKTDPGLRTYFKSRTGPFTTPVAIEGLGYLNVDDLSAENEEPNLEIIFINLTPGLLMQKIFGFKSTYYSKFFRKTTFRHGYTLFPMLTQPKSRGKVLLRSSNPKDNPKIFANYFSDPDDIRVGIKIIRKTIEVAKSKAFQKYGSTMNNNIVPGCERHKPNSDSYWECALRTLTITFWHHCGTCKMGAENDPSAVVNTKLQVRGIKHLRVADASVMSMIPTAHLNIPTIALAEKAADLIKSHWNYTLIN